MENMKNFVERMDWYDIQSEFDAMSKMSCAPVDIKKLPTGHIIDEDKSVKWNREQVELNNKKYQEEVARLNTLKNKRRDEIRAMIYAKIAYEVGHNLSEEKAKLIWNLAWERGHSYGISDVIGNLNDLIELVQKILD